MEEGNIERKLKGLNVEIPGPIVLLPDNLNSAYSKDDLNYSLAQRKAIGYFSQKDVNVGLDIETEVYTRLSIESEISRIVLDLLILYSQQVALGVLIDFLSDIIKGKLFGGAQNIKVRIYHENSDKPLVDYDGSINGFSTVIDEVKKLNKKD